MTPLTDDLLRRRLADRAASAPAGSLAAIASSVTARPQRRALGPTGRWTAGGWAAAAVVIGIVIVGGLVTRAVGPISALGSADASAVTGSSASLGAAPASVIATTPSPMPSRWSPPVTGCDTLRFDARRCAAVVARAEQSIDDSGRVVSILVRRPTGGDVSAGSFAIATVEFTLVGGTTQSADVRCGLAGPRSSDRACSDDPQVWVAGGVSRDIPCGPSPGDDQHPCGPLPPDPAPATIAAARPLVLRTFDVPVDRRGHYEVLMGTATIPNGAISEIVADVGDPHPTGFWIDPYIRIEVRPDRGGPPIDTYYGRRVDGQLPVHVYLVFDVTDLTDTGSVLEIRNLVVR